MILKEGNEILGLLHNYSHFIGHSHFLKFQEHMDKQRLSIVDFFALLKYWKDAFTDELLRNSWGLGQCSCVSGV